MAGLFFIYASVQNVGYLDATDAEARLDVTRSIMDAGEFRVSLRVDGDQELRPSKYTILTSVVAWPMVMLGRWLEPVSELSDTARYIRDVQWFVLGHAFWTAIGVGVLGLLFRVLGCGARWSLSLALATGLATVLFPYAKSAQTEGMTSGVFVGLILAAWYHAGRPGVVRGIIPGLLVGALIAIKMELAVCLPAVVLHMFWAAWRGPQEGRWNRVLHSALGFGLGLLPMAGWVLGWNALRYGNPFSTGYGEIRTTGQSDGAFSTPLWWGMFLSLLTPGKSFFVYAPICLLGLFGWFRLSPARSRALPLLILGVSLPPVLVYGMWFSPMGGTAIGSRLHVILVGIMAAGLAGWFGRGARPSTLYGVRPLIYLGVLVVAGLAMILPFVATSFIIMYHNTIPAGNHELRVRAHETMAMSLPRTPQGGAWELLTLGYWDFRWLIWRPVSERLVVHPMFAVLVSLGCLFVGLAYAIVGAGTKRVFRYGLVLLGLIVPLPLVSWLAVGGTRAEGPVAIARDGVKREVLARYGTLAPGWDGISLGRQYFMGWNQNPATITYSGYLRVTWGDVYEFRWTVDGPGYVRINNSDMALGPTGERRIVRRYFELPLSTGFHPMEIRVFQLWNRRGVNRLEWRRKGEREFRPVPPSRFLSPTHPFVLRFKENTP